MVIKTTKETLYTLSARIESGKPFHYVRMGDGRILMIGGEWGGEASDHFKNDKLIEILRKVLAINDPDFLIGMHIDLPLEEGMRSGTFGNYKNNDGLRKVVEKYTDKKEFENSVPLHYNALDLNSTYLGPELVVNFFRKLKDKKVVFVGGSHLHDMTDFDFIDHFVTTPKIDAFEEAEDIQKQILKHKPDVVLFSAGACSHVLQYWTYQTENNITTLDIGSFADLCLGLDTRQFISDNHQKVQGFIKLFNYNFKK